MPIPAHTRYHRIDGWRGYLVPKHAVAGVSDTGTWDDSPAPSGKVRDELQWLGRYLHKFGIKWRIQTTQSSNVFMVKRWLTVRPRDFERAAQLTVDWLESHVDHTHYIHEADLDKLGYGPTEKQEQCLTTTPAS